jgi:hypothetical protein
MIGLILTALTTCSRLTALSLPPDCDVPLDCPPLAVLHTLHGVTMGVSGFQRLADEAPCLRDLDVILVGRLAVSAVALCNIAL